MLYRNSLPGYYIAKQIMALQYVTSLFLVSIGHPVNTEKNGKKTAHISGKINIKTPCILSQGCNILHIFTPLLFHPCLPLTNSRTVYNNALCNNTAPGMPPCPSSKRERRLRKSKWLPQKTFQWWHLIMESRDSNCELTREVQFKV